MGSTYYDYRDSIDEQERLVEFQDSILQKTQEVLLEIDTSIHKLKNIEKNIISSAEEIDSVSSKSDFILDDITKSIAQQKHLVEESEVIFDNIMRARYPIYPLEINITYTFDFSYLEKYHKEFVDNINSYVQNNDINIHNKKSLLNDRYPLLASERVMLYSENQADSTQNWWDSYVRKSFLPKFLLSMCEKDITQYGKLNDTTLCESWVIPVWNNGILNINERDLKKSVVAFSYNILLQRQELEITLYQTDIHNYLSFNNIYQSIFDFKEEGTIVVQITNYPYEKPFSDCKLKELSFYFGNSNTNLKYKLSSKNLIDGNPLIYKVKMNMNKHLGTGNKILFIK